MKKKALIFGITGQDGSYLARLLLKKNYIVHGVIRRSSSFNTQRIEEIYRDPHEKTNLYLHYGDVLDSLSTEKIISKTKPHEVYNLAAQSHVGVSFEVPEYTANTVALGTLRILIFDIPHLFLNSFYKLIYHIDTISLLLAIIFSLFSPRVLSNLPLNG